MAERPKDVLLKLAVYQGLLAASGAKGINLKLLDTCGSGAAHSRTSRRDKRLRRVACVVHTGKRVS